MADAGKYILGAVGATIGFIFLGPGGASLGWSLGVGVGSLVFPPQGPHVEGPRLNDLTVQSATYGTVKPVVYGRVRIAGNIIWKTDIVERSSTEQQGKGGGGGSSTTFTYFGNAALGICEGGEGADVWTIWADGKVIWALDPTTNTVTEKYPGCITVWNGAETQLPSAMMESHDGVGNVPAYRGTLRVDFEMLPLADFGNRIPNFTFEVSVFKRAQAVFLGESMEAALWQHGYDYDNTADGWLFETKTTYSRAFDPSRNTMFGCSSYRPYPYPEGTAISDVSTGVLCYSEGDDLTLSTMYSTVLGLTNIVSRICVEKDVKPESGTTIIWDGSPVRYQFAGVYGYNNMADPWTGDYWYVDNDRKKFTGFWFAYAYVLRRNDDYKLNEYPLAVQCQLSSTYEKARSMVPVAALEDYMVFSTLQYAPDGSTTAPVNIYGAPAIYGDYAFVRKDVTHRVWPAPNDRYYGAYLNSNMNGGVGYNNGYMLPEKVISCPKGLGLFNYCCTQDNEIYFFCDVKRFTASSGLTPGSGLDYDYTDGTRFRIWKLTYAGGFEDVTPWSPGDSIDTDIPDFISGPTPPEIGVDNQYDAWTNGTQTEIWVSARANHDSDYLYFYRTVYTDNVFQVGGPHDGWESFHGVMYVVYFRPSTGEYEHLTWDIGFDENWNAVPYGDPSMSYIVTRGIYNAMDKRIQNTSFQFPDRAGENGKMWVSVRAYSYLEADYGQTHNVFVKLRFDWGQPPVVEEVIDASTAWKDDPNVVKAHTDGQLSAFDPTDAMYLYGAFPLAAWEYDGINNKGNLFMSEGLGWGNDYTDLDPTWVAGSQKWQDWAAHGGWLYLYTAVSADYPTLAYVVSDICYRCGLSTDLVDTSALGTQTINGYAVSQQASGRDILTPLQQVYLFDGIESMGVMVWSYRIKEAVGDIVYSDLGSTEGTTSTGAGLTPIRLQEVRTQDIDLPRSVTFQYPDPTLHYNPGTATDQRYQATQSSQQNTTIQTPVVLYPEQADQMVKKALFLSWVGRTNYSFNLPIKYLKYDPGDVLNLTVSGLTTAIYLTGMTVGGNGLIECQGTSTDKARYVGNPELSTATPVYVTPDIPTSQAMQSLFIDGPLLRDADDLNYGFYFASDGVTDGNWRGGTLFKSANDTDFTVVQSVAHPFIGGLVPTALDDAGNANQCLIDRTNTITVNMLAGSFNSISDADFYNGQNVAMLGDELLAFRDVLQTGPTTYVLSYLRRGLQGTDWAISGHGVNETLILISGTVGIGKVDLTSAEQGASRFYRNVTTGEAIGDVTSITYTSNSSKLKPLSPCQIVGSRDGSNNLTITWDRRMRKAIEWVDSVEGGLDEPTESYEIDIYNGPSVVRTITGLSSATASYSAADQTTDFGSPQASLHIKVYQISSRVGRGYPGDVTI